MSNLYAVIMAGGRGERFWPLSRGARPKQCLRIFSAKTMIEETVDTLETLIPRNNIYISTGQHLYDPIKEVLPDVGYVVEPVGRDTAACIGLSALKIYERDPEGIIFIETADHVYKDKNKYLRHVRAAAELAASNHIVLIGITPTFPSTGFGYIQQGEEVEGGEGTAYKVKAFKEKPDHKTADAFVDSGDYLWNSGMFLFKCSVILEAIQKHMPSLYAGLQKISNANFDETVMQDVFAGLEKISVDYGVMEKAENTVVVRGDMPWDDIGDWLALERLTDPDKNGNTVKGNFIGRDTSNSIIFSEDKLVATLGVKDLIIVATDDAVLICDKNQAQDIKTVVKSLDSRYT